MKSGLPFFNAISRCERRLFAIVRGRRGGRVPDNEGRDVALHDSLDDVDQRLLERG